MFLAGPRLGSLTVDEETNAHGTGEGDHGHIGMIDQCGTDLLADAKQTVYNSGWQADFLKDLHELGANDRRLFRRLHDNCVAGDQGGSRHAAQNCQGKIPGCNDDGDAARLIKIGVFLARHVTKLWPGQAEHLARVVIAVVDAFGNIGVRFTPLLAAFVNFPGRELEAPAAHHVGRLEKIARAYARFGIAPGGKRPPRRLDCQLGVRNRSAAATANYLLGMRRVNGFNRGPVAHRLPANY